MKKDTIYFNHFYSTTGVGNTCDAEFSALNSLYPNDIRECYRMYVDNTYNGLPWMFREKGYSAMAFHGYVKTVLESKRGIQESGVPALLFGRRTETDSDFWLWNYRQGDVPPGS